MASGLFPLDPPEALGRIQLLARLGEGGMATVYLAAVGEGALVRPAAVKLLRADVPDHDYRTRFLDEAKLVVRLHHNNLVDVREAGEIDGRLYITMEVVEGRDLAGVWDAGAVAGQAFPVALSVHVVREVCRGLHYAHQAEGLGLVHRDVSPSNVLIDWAGAVRLADFGLATSSIRAATTVPGVVFGKVGYMSPEQARRRPLDARSDVYSCGVILWELLTGRAMRDAGSDTNTAARGVVVPPSTLSARVDAGLDAILEKALARDVDQRYESARALQDALSAWLTEHAPATGQDTVAAFMQGLFGDVRLHERETMRRLLERGAGPGRTLLLGSGSRGIRSSPEDSTMTGRTMADEHIDAGTVIAGRYRVLSRMGQGGMGTVYAGEHLTVGRAVAIKVLTHHWSSDEGVAARFQTEARAASTAGHPNIVEVFDAGQLPDGRFFLVMEFLTGRSLFEEVRQVGTLEVARAVRILRDVGRAIRSAHGAGIIHRDLKPENVMLSDRGEEEAVKVLDFGVCASEDGVGGGERMTQAGQAVGTPEYMAPEQALGEPPTPSIDIYALGVLAYEMLVGQTPFVSGSVMEILARKTSEDAPSLAKARPDAPADLVDLVDRCLSRDPTVRPATVGGLLGELDEVLRKLPRKAAARPHARTQPAMVAPAPSPAPAGRRSTVLVLLAVAALVVVGGFGAYFLGGIGAPSPPEDSARASSAVPAPQSPQPEPQPQPQPEPQPQPANTSPPPPTPTKAPEKAPIPKPEPPAERPAKAPVPAPAPAPSPTPTPDPSETPRCVRVRESAAQGMRRRIWPSVLRHTSDKDCFPEQSRRTHMRVSAHKELGDFAHCISEGEGSGDSRVQKLVKFCKARLAREGG